jgi:hypothetical protein
MCFWMLLANTVKRQMLSLNLGEHIRLSSEGGACPKSLRPFRPPLALLPIQSVPDAQYCPNVIC